MKKYRLAMLGTGNIASFHLEAFKKAGFDISHCASKKNSERAKLFAKTNSIEYFYNNPFDLIENHKNWDMILLAINTEDNFQYLNKIIDLDKVCLVEKPVSIKLENLEMINRINIKGDVTIIDKKILDLIISEKKYDE